MRYIGWFLAGVACLTFGMAGLAIGINFNPESTVKFVLVWDSGTWAAIGACAGAIFTAAAVWLSLYYSRHDFREGVKLISETHLAAGSNSLTKMTLRAVCTGRLPTTVLSIGFRLKTTGVIHPVSEFTGDYDSKRKLERGDIFEARLQAYDLQQIARKFSKIVGTNVRDIELSVRTGLDTHSSPLSKEASELLERFMKAALGEGPPVII
ncbi:hypothetical protein [Pseudomonas sp. A014]|uniref:hypothetical protein n=1 Tax=Pseudomonas sp. A014 TaxID=3458058 RepID=UPI0040352DB7